MKFSCFEDCLEVNAMVSLPYPLLVHFDKSVSVNQLIISEV